MAGAQHSGPRLRPRQQALTASTDALDAGQHVIFGVSGIMMGVLNSFQHFLLPALAPVSTT